MSTKLAAENPADVTNEEYVSRAQALAPKLRERSPATNAARRISMETIEEMRDANLFSLLQPKRFGGSERGLVPYVDCVTSMAAGCASAGWVFSVLSIHVFQLGLYPEQAQIDVWGANPRALIASSYMPGGKAIPTKGGYTLSGRWKFSSGCQVAEWIILGAVIDGTGGGGPPEVRFMLLPMSDVEIIDVWDVIGLRGTGSNDIGVKEIFVPEHRTLKMQEAVDGVSPGSKVNPGPLYCLPMYAVFPVCLCSPGVGNAKGAMDVFIEMMSGYTTGRGASVGDFHTTQARLGEASALIDAAELILRRDAAEIMETSAAGDKLTMEQRARCRRDHAFTAEYCMRAVDQLYKVTGGAGLQNDNPLQGYFRDAHAIAAHIANNWDIAGPLYGAVRLGRNPNHPAV